MSLPPLPEPINGVDGPDGPWPLFTTEQMQAYAKLAVREALERAAQACKDYAVRCGYKEPTNCMTGGTTAIGCEVLIRAMLKEYECS